MLPAGANLRAPSRLWLAARSAGVVPAPEPRDPCAPGAQEDYDVGLHAAAVLILLLVSLGGSLGPLALRLSSHGPAVSTAIRLGTYFGFGAILATAFVHMLLPAAAAFASPCLPPGWRDGYDAWAYVFTVAAVLLMHLVDFVLKGRHLQWLEAERAQQQQWRGVSGEEAATCSHGGLPPHELAEGCHALHVAVIRTLSSKEATVQPSAAAAAAAAAAERVAEGGAAGGSGNRGLCPAHGDACSPLLGGRHSADGSGGALAAAAAMPSAVATANQIVGLYLAEAGLMFHSVMIGVTLGVTGGAAFKTLLVALAFHQFFEGFAIGSAAVDSGLSPAQSTAMGLAFSVTTPLGIAIGIAARATLNSRAGGALLAAGICDALSAGVLIYTVLCDLITPAMTDSRWLRAQRWPLQAAAFLALYAGAAAMATVGRWM